MTTNDTLLWAGFAFAAAFAVWRRRRKARRAAFIRTYEWPAGLMAKFAKKRPDFSEAQRRLTGDALRQFFLAYHASGRKYVSMPSQAADDLWHEFILYTRAYEEFCQKAFGGFFHHTPAAVLAPEKRQSNVGLRRIWVWCCALEKISPTKPGRLPLLFALDGTLSLVDGFHYAADCKALRRAGVASTPYCGGDFSSSGVDGSTDGFDSTSSGCAGDNGGGGSDAGGDSSSSSSDGGGCSGGGCSGGCGGGGGD
jgi:hypothetical protein